MSQWMAPVSLNERSRDRPSDEKEFFLSPKNGSLPTPPRRTSRSQQPYSKIIIRWIHFSHDEDESLDHDIYHAITPVFRINRIHGV